MSRVFVKTVNEDGKIILEQFREDGTEQRVTLDVGDVESLIEDLRSNAGTIKHFRGQG